MGKDLEQKEILYRFVKSYKIFLEKYEIDEDFFKLFNEICFKKYKKKNFYSFSDFIKLHGEEPIKNFIMFENKEMKDINEDIREFLEYKIIENGRINDELLFFLEKNKSLEDLQQSEWNKVLEYLRKVDKREVEPKRLDYVYLRRDTITLKPFMKKTELLAIMQKFHLKKPLKNLLENAYIPYGKDTAVLCKNCKYPMEFNLNKKSYFCAGNKICKHYDLRYLIDIEKEIDTKKEKYVFLKKGFYLFTTLPGLFEVFVENLLKKNNILVESSPNIEANGDLKVSTLLEEVYIDCKMHQNEEELFKKIVSDYKKEKINYYVLPSFLYKGKYKDKLDTLNLGLEKPIKFLTEKELIKKIKI